jgi:hypothetical protein
MRSAQITPRALHSLIETVFAMLSLFPLRYDPTRLDQPLRKRLVSKTNSSWYWL